jgi:hypothetical protein
LLSKLWRRRIANASVIRLRQAVIRNDPLRASFFMTEAQQFSRDHKYPIWGAGLRCRNRDAGAIGDFFYPLILQMRTPRMGHAALVAG